jgi:hypothetical protein
VLCCCFDITGGFVVVGCVCVVWMHCMIHYRDVSLPSMLVNVNVIYALYCSL